MTWEEREAIFSKEVLRPKDLALLLNVSEETARNKIAYIRTKSDRLGIPAACHIQDYFDVYKLPVERYLMPKKVRPYEEQEQKVTKEFLKEAIVDSLTELVRSGELSV